MAGFFRQHDPFWELDQMFRDLSRRPHGMLGFVDTSLPALMEEGRGQGAQGAPGRKGDSTALAPFGGPGQLVQWAPKFDVKEADNQLVVHAELPGVPKENVTVDIRNGLLTVSGKKEEAHEEKNDKWYVKERSYGSFSRSVRLPSDVNQDGVKARFDNGVLEVTVPKAPKPEEQRKTITIE